jgi:alpha-amylase/alpha-mannosidase (GH57 family)
MRHPVQQADVTSGDMRPRGPAKKKDMTVTPKFVCVHGHFYQPPRENPWLEEIEIQDSAHPYHDWNARITAECYARNTAARILDDRGRIVRITNNYARMSFNYGPTLLSWMERNRPDVYAAILEADRLSQERFSGHGSALAQPYNHLIMPLANLADRATQVLWGVRDFKHRFGRPPEGMWLPEAAVDLETLVVMAEAGIRFTILSPHQADRIRPFGADDWQDVSDGSINPRQPYLQRLPNESRIAVFFYDGPISRDVAFNNLLNDGGNFADRLIGAFDGVVEEAQLVHLATDGETFGHHHRFGDMALAYALEKIDTDDAARLTNYGEFLEIRPPEWQVEIKENTSWSCVHGVERWKSNCGCHSGRRPQWHQEWREPLRNALDWLRDRLSEVYTRSADGLLENPWMARDDYIAVILDRSDVNIESFLRRHMTGPPDNTTRSRALKMLEMQRQAMLMYTSCGWFFDELSGIESVQVLQYAGRAVQLAGELTGDDIEAPFLDRLAAAKSNIPKHKDGRHIYQKWVKPAHVDLKKAAAHYAISSFFEDYPERVTLFCYSLENLDSAAADAGRSKIAAGRARITSQTTRESAAFSYAVLHMGDHNISCGISMDDTFDDSGMRRDLMETFDRSDLPELFRTLGLYFPDAVYSLTSLFRDEQRKVLDTILEATTTGALTIYRQLYENNVPLMRFINDSSSRIPKSLYMAGEIVINSDLNHEFGREALDYAAIRLLIENAERSGITLDADTLEFTLRQNLERLARNLVVDPVDIELLRRLSEGVALAVELPFTVRFQQVQNSYWQLGQTALPAVRQRANKGDAAARRWQATFLRLAKTLKMRME